ncbi:MAG TPA: alpha/beta hydrolase [Thermoflexus sp.]|nr:alpha/beta hydrolase [Thermoflexus sp.]
MPEQIIDGEVLYYAVHADPGARRSLILIHGAGESHLVWPRALRNLRGAIVYALDLPGHGRSRGRGRSSIAEYAEVIVRWMEAVGIPEAVWVGHSMGGAIAQWAALHHPERVAGLVLIATGARLRVSPQILEGLRSNFPQTVDLITEWSWGTAPPAQLVEEGRRMLLAMDPTVVEGDYRACDAFDVMGQLEAIRVPTLVIGGTADRMTPMKYAEYLAAHIPGAQLVRIEGAGHMVMLEQPEAVAEAVRSFLDRLT